MPKHSYQSGLIGNCAYIAHIEKDTNVSWLCFPRFDSDFIFGGMLDREKGGEFTILPNRESLNPIRLIWKIRMSSRQILFRVQTATASLTLLRASKTLIATTSH
ncbi:trehalase-like domain-containing protein [Algoriphagus boritolerans]|uniref:trehalase-like domain-containing protein n=1 Tax=Algoriphagus boritolerans TaxID=308111 RepID=UPI002FCDF6B7